MAITEIEMAISRIEWMKTIIREPTHHHLYLTALFGEYYFERGEDTSNPWRAQFMSDIRRLLVFHDWNWCVEEIVRAPRNIWEDKEVQWEKQKCDPKRPRAAARKRFSFRWE